MAHMDAEPVSLRAKKRKLCSDIYGGTVYILNRLRQKRQKEKDIPTFTISSPGCIDFLFT
jgi:hypothetical protein